jgi:hypothetical protein
MFQNCENWLKANDFHCQTYQVLKFYPVKFEMKAQTIFLFSALILVASVNAQKNLCAALKGIQSGKIKAEKTVGISAKEAANIMDKIQTYNADYNFQGITLKQLHADVVAIRDEVAKSTNSPFVKNAMKPIEEKMKGKTFTKAQADAIYKVTKECSSTNH